MSITGADYEKVMALNAKGLTNAEIEAATGVSSRTVSRMREWAVGAAQPSPASMPLLGRLPLTGVIEKHMEAGYTLDERDLEKVWAPTDLKVALAIVSGRLTRLAWNAMGTDERGKLFRPRGFSAWERGTS
jgi:hypothetical protein